MLSAKRGGNENFVSIGWRMTPFGAQSCFVIVYQKDDILWRSVCFGLAFSGPVEDDCFRAQSCFVTEL